MGCEYCRDEKVILEKEIISGTSWGWGYGADGEIKISYNEAMDGVGKFGFFIDKRCDNVYLRFADLDDCSCLESGDKVEIKFCPFCGEEIPKMKEWGDNAI